MQGFFKDMNAICKVLNIGQPVLQIMTVLSFVSRVLKNDKGSVISAKNDCKYEFALIFFFDSRISVHDHLHSDRVYDVTRRELRPS